MVVESCAIHHGSVDQRRSTHGRSPQDSQILSRRNDHIQTIRRPIEERSHLEKLVDALPKGIEQRTPEWYAAREGLITASNFHKAAAKPEQFIRDKLKDKPSLGSDATRWGVKYEDVANLLYSHYIHTRDRVWTFTPSNYRTSRCLSDGITPYGVMVEVKCPYSKTLKDIPKNRDKCRDNSSHADSMNVTSSFVA
jgi:hypothetical protein